MGNPPPEHDDVAASRAPRQHPPPQPTGERVTYAITNLIRVSGLCLALKTGLLDVPLDTRILAVAAFMMAGAQGIEVIIGALTAPRR